MNHRLINQFLLQAAKAPEGERMYVFASLLADHCATIVDIDPKHASNTIRGAFVTNAIERTPAAKAVIEAMQ